MKSLMKYAAFAAVASIAVGAVNPASAGTINIMDYIDDQGHAAGEAAITADIVINDGGDLGDITITAYGASGSTPATSYGTTQTDVYAYLDYNNAGMGVCSGGISASGVGADACDTGSDDNVGIGDNGDEVTEVLSISFGETYNIDTFYFRNEGHTEDFYPGDNDYVDEPQKIDVKIDDGAWVTYYLTDVNSGELGATLFLPGPDANDPITGSNELGPLEDFASTSFIHFRNVPDTDPRTQFYLSAIDISEASSSVVPLPAGFLLMLSGLFGLGFLGRYKAKLT